MRNVYRIAAPGEASSSEEAGSEEIPEGYHWGAERDSEGKFQLKLIKDEETEAPDVFSVPDGVKEIGDYAFTVCLRLKKLALPDSLQTIGEGAFSDCRTMTALTVPDSVTEIGAELLKNHSSKLKITCAKDSTMQSYLESNYPKVSIVQPKK